MSHEQSDFIGARARGLLDAFADPVQVVSPDGTFVYVNRAWCQRLGYAEPDALGMGFLDLIHPDHVLPWKTIFKSVLGGERLDDFEMALIAKDGSHVPVDASVWAQDGSNGPEAVCAVFRDLGRREQSGQKLARQLYRDQSTGLYNRRGFGVRSAPLLETLADNPERAGGFVLYVEIANLDQIERRHGVDAEHDALTRTAEVLHRALRLHDVVARLSRATFAALIALPPRYQPSYIATRIRAALQHVNRHARTPYEVELAIGLAPADPREPLWEAVENARAAAIGAAHKGDLP